MRKAREFRLAAQLVEEGDVGGTDLTDAYITMCVHAGIAAAELSVPWCDWLKPRRQPMTPDQPGADLKLRPYY